MKKTLILIFVLMVFSSCAWASEGSTAKSFPESFVVSSGTVSGAAFSSFSVAGETAAGNISGSHYISQYGAAAAILAPSLPGPDEEPPKISDLKFEGKSIQNNDYVSSSATITAKITDESGIDQALSQIEIDSGKWTFSNLPSNSSYDAATGILSVKYPFGEGAHTFLIRAQDILGNITTTEVSSFKVSLTDLKIEGSVLNYPNPFAPPAQSTKISYMLSKDSELKIYIFNQLNQPVKKFDISSGAEGGKAGYNSVTWDGATDFGDIVSNDIYFARIVSNGKVLGKCKIAVVK